MALVAYDASDSEGITDEEEDVSSGVEIVQNSTQIETKLFNHLPNPKATNPFTDITEENDEFLLKKEQPTEKPTKKPIKISAPSLQDFDSDEDEPKEKKTKFVSKSSGLFSILPPPKSATFTTKSLIPNSVAKKAKNPMIPQSVAKKTPAAKKTAVKLAQSIKSTSDDDDDDIHVEEFDLNAWKQVCGRKPKPEPIVEVIDHTQSIIPVIDTAREPEKPYEGLDNEAFKKLVGSSRMQPQNIKLIDINEEQVMTDEDILRSKALTDPEVEHVAKVEEPISAMSKKKHHITYLAQQAKANEQDLKNRWASNRFSRKQTQAKYGF